MTNKDDKVTFRVDKLEKSILEAKARELGLPVSTMIRECLPIIVNTDSNSLLKDKLSRELLLIENKKLESDVRIIGRQYYANLNNIDVLNKRIETKGDFESLEGTAVNIIILNVLHYYVSEGWSNVVDVKDFERLSLTHKYELESLLSVEKPLSYALDLSDFIDKIHEYLFAHKGEVIELKDGLKLCIDNTKIMQVVMWLNTLLELSNK